MTTSHSSVRIAVLDDYQGVAREMADWSHVEERARVDVFSDHLTDDDAVVDQRRHPPASLAPA
jgi:hypothetical protein